MIFGSEFKLDNNIYIRLAINSLRKDLLIQDFSSDIISGLSGGIGLKKFDRYYDIGFRNLGPAGLMLGFSISKKLN